MTSPLNRPLTDLKIARLSAYEELQTSLGQTLGKVYEAPTDSTLLPSAIEKQQADSTKFTESQIEQKRLSDLERFREITSLRGQLQTGALSPEEEQEAYTRLEQIQKEEGDEYRSLLDQSIEEGRLVSEEQLKEKYGELGLEFDRPMTQREAEILVEHKRAELVRQAIISKGPSGVGASVAQFGVGILAVATDPVGLASMFVPVVGQGRTARIIAKYGAVRGRAMVGAIEGGVGTLMTEPLFYGLSKNAQLDYEMTDAIFNIAAGTVLGGGIGTLAGTLARRAGARAGAGEAPRTATGAQPGTTLPRSPQTPTRVAPDAPTVVRPEVPDRVNQEATSTAVRQFVNDEPVLVNRFFDGTDLRGTTAIIRAGGYEFQTSSIANQISPQVPSVTYRVADEEGVLQFRTRKEAEAMADQVEGWVRKLGRSWVIEKSAQGEVLRKPSGEVASFKTRSAAEAVVKPLQEAGEDVAIIARGDEADYAIARGMNEEDVESMSNNGGFFDIEDAPSSQDLSVRPEGAPDGKPLTGPAAEKELAAAVLKDTEKAREASEETRYAREVDEEIETEFDDRALMDEIADLEAELKQNGILDDPESVANDLDDDIDFIQKLQAAPVEPRFYSPALRVIQDAKTDKATPEAWMAILSKAGVKKAEMEWMGLEEFLVGYQKENGLKSIDRQVVADYIEANQIEIKELTMIEAVNSDEVWPLREQLESMYAEHYRLEQKLLEGLREMMARKGFFSVREKSGQDIREALIRRYLTDQDDSKPIGGYLRPYDVWSKEAKEYYTALKENVPKDPVASQLVVEEAEFRDAVIRFEDDNPMAAQDPDDPIGFEEHLLPYGENYREIGLQIPDLHKTGLNRGLDKTEFSYDVHFDHPNLVVHALLKDRLHYGQGGEVIGKSLHAEEIQSDLSATWRGDPEEMKAKYKRSLAISEEIMSIQQNNRYPYKPEVQSRLDSLHREHLSMGTVMPMDDFTPRSPFNTEQSYRLMARHLLKKAIDEGYDEISWSSSNVIIDRWGEKNAEGFKRAYDQQIKKAFDSLVKKHGGRVELAPAREYDNLYDTNAENLDFWSIEITPEIKKAMAEPQPVYQTGFPGAAHVRPDIGDEVLPVLREGLDRMGLHNVRVKIDKSNRWQGAFVGRRYGPMDIIIAHSFDEQATLHHEAIHAMRWLDLFEDEEWSVLSKAAQDHWIREFDIETRYPELGLEEQIEEAIAEAFGGYASNRVRVEPELKSIWDKIKSLFEAFRAAFRGLDKEQVFDRIYSGQVGRREPGTLRGDRPDLARQEQPLSIRDRMSTETRVELDEIPEMEKKHEAWKTVIETVANCVGLRP